LAKSSLNALYWEERYRTQDTGWDIGHISTPLKAYADTLTAGDKKILIPGAGNGHEAIYLYQNGFKNVYVLDWSSLALASIKERCPDFPQDHLICGDFFEHQGQYDLILEQTFFCAINPVLRPKYTAHMSQLLKPKGRLVGLLFDAPLNQDFPPFGGSKEEYLEYFRPYFALETFEAAHNSIPQRAGRELFINLIKP
jgi:SAM-dependent methyltransferase